MTILKSLSYDDVLLIPNYGSESRDDGNVSCSLGPYNFDIPIISANMDTITGVTMCEAMGKVGGLGILHRFMTIEDNIAAAKEIQKRVGYAAVSVGVGEDEYKRADKLYAAGVRLFCVDIAHAHSKQMGKMVKHLKREFPETFVISGNVATYGGADYLASVGADCVKVGVGAGSVCTTREVTGFGVPQLTAILDCSRIDVPIIADGGLRKSSDVVKALAAGATMVMLGGMLAGTEEALGGNAYRGMASVEARNDYFRATSGYRVAEGTSTIVSSKGPVEKVVEDIIGGLKSGMSYAGASDLSELRRKAVFIEVSNATYVEGTPHGAI